MKRQNSQLSSTSRRDPPPPDHTLRAKSIGCMSGIIHLLSKYQNRHKKSLTFGKSKPEKDIIVFSDQTLASPNRTHKEGKRTLTEAVDFSRRSTRTSCDLPTRSPTLSAEIRCSSRSVKSPETTIGKTPALVARLMGLEAVAPPASSEIKRRKLLGALEKCDNDLKALRDIIMAFRSPETPIAGKGNCLNPDKVIIRTISAADGEKQRHLNRINRTVRGRENGREEIIQEQQLKKKKKNPAAVDEDEDTAAVSISSSFNLNFIPITKLQERIMKLQQSNKQNPTTATQFEISKPPSSTIIMAEIEKKKKKKNKANMAESLDEISNEISWGFKHEMAKIGMALQHHIYTDLVHEMLNDMPFSSSSLPPFEACRRRLRF